MDLKKISICFTLSRSNLYYICMTQREIEILFKKHYTRMYHLAVSILYDEDESKDVVSDVFSRLMASDVSLHPDSAEAYLLTGVRNQCRNVMERKHVRERFVQLFSDESLPIGNPRSGMTTEPLTTTDEHLRMEELVKYVEGHLSPLSQQIFRLRYLREMTCKEVADALGVSRMTVHNHLRTSVEQIRAYFKSIR